MKRAVLNMTKHMLSIFALSIVAAGAQAIEFKGIALGADLKTPKAANPRIIGWLVIG